MFFTLPCNSFSFLYFNSFFFSFFFTIQELRVTRTSSRIGRAAAVDEVDTHHPPRSPCQSRNVYNYSSSQQNTGTTPPLLQPLVIQFTIVLQVTTTFLIELRHPAL